MKPRSRSIDAGPAGPVLALLLACMGLACAAVGPREGTIEPVEPVRMSELVEEGDAARRASQRLIVQGLQDDRVGRHARARASYERALQVDGTNPYAYLAIARQDVDGARPERALPYLDKAAALLQTEEGDDPRGRVHVIGLRGEAMYASGRIDEGTRLLEQARQMAPEVWGDGRLAPEELL